MVDKKFSEFTTQATPLSTDQIVGLNTAVNDNIKLTIANLSTTVFSLKDTDDLTEGATNKYFTSSLSQDLDCNDNNLTEVKTITANSEVVDTYAATKTIDFSTGSKRTVTLTGNSTITFSAPGIGSSYILRVIQDGTGSHTITYANLDAKQVTAPDLKTDANGETYIIVNYNGSTYTAQSFKVE